LKRYSFSIEEKIEHREKKKRDSVFIAITYQHVVSTVAVVGGEPPQKLPEPVERSCTSC